MPIDVKIFYFCYNLRANEGQVQEVLSSIRESSESEGQGSNSSLAMCGDDPNMPTQDEVRLNMINCDCRLLKFSFQNCLIFCNINCI